MSITLAVTSDAAHGVLVVRFLCLFFHTARHELAVPIARHKLVSRTLGPSCAIFVVRIQSITVKQKTVSKQCR